MSIRFNEESGLARPEVYDWPATVPKILASNAYDVIVVMLGANDRQTIRDGEQRYRLRHAGMDRGLRRARSTGCSTSLPPSKARIIWVGAAADARSRV